MPHSPARLFFDSLRPAILILTLLLAIWPDAGRAAEAPSSEERRSSIHQADGYAYLSGDKTLNDTRAEAMADAKRSAVGMALTYLSATTVVENLMLKQDRVEVSEAGAVTVLEMKDYGLENNQRYHVWIKAEVGFELPAGLGANDSREPLTVRLWSDQARFRAGEEIAVMLEGNRDFYGRIVNIAAAGSITQLLPNAYRRESRFKAGVTYRIPAPEDHFRLVVSPPFGTERIVVYASEAPLGEVALTPAAGGLERFAGSRESLATLTRAIKVVPAGGAGGGAQFYERTLSLATEP